MAPVRLYTLGQIAAELGQREHRIRFIIDSRRIEPNAVAGHMRVWSATDVVRIKSELAAIDAAKGGAA